MVQTRQKTEYSFIPIVINKYTARIYTWRNRVPQGALERLELLDAKVSRAVLRGRDGGNTALLLDTLATLSDGEKFENQKHYRALIGLENLNVKGMLANHCLAQAVSDASFFEVKRQLFYKSEQYGSSVQLVDRWFPSSKTCHSCGWVKEDLTLADRVWVCAQCGTVHDRDLNAAIMVESEALRKVPDVPAVASSERKIACGAERSGPAMGETVCGEAGTTML